jgi:predicted acylesterase/phospholipase RssA
MEILKLIRRIFMRFINILFLYIFLNTTNLFAVDVSYPIKLKLRFNKEPETSSYLWERQILPDDTCWAFQKYKGREWEPVPELPRKIKVGLALAGGFVRGFSHIGVLKVFEENNIPIYGIAGTSIGAIVGGIYACGYSINTLEWIIKNDIDWETFLSDLPPRRYLPLWERLREKPREPGLDLNFTGKLWSPFRYTPGRGIRVAQKFTDEIARLTLESDFRAGFQFDYLPIPFGAVVTNLKTGESEIMRDGTLSAALRASGSVPVIFEPIEIGGKPYVDGGVLNDLPVDAFIRYDESRAPKNAMNIIGGDTINYVIAVYPSIIRGFKEKTEEQKFYGPLGLGMLYDFFFLVRDYNIQDSWDAADGKIDMDVKGGFDFSPERLDDMINIGYNAAMDEILQIKREIVARENNRRLSKDKERIHQISSIELFNIAEDDTTKLKLPNEIERINRAIRIKKGSYVEKIDICDALKRIHKLGEFEDVLAEINNIDDKWELSFFLKYKKEYKNHIKVFLKAKSTLPCDSLVAKNLMDEIKRKKRVLNFNEVKELLETYFIAQGFVAPKIDSIKFKTTELSFDILNIYIDIKANLIGAKIRCDDDKLRIELEQEFKPPLNPWKILKKTEYVSKEFQLKSVILEGLKNDSLIISVRKKSTHTLEFPSISYEMYEGLSFFTELRSRRLKNFFNWSYFINYSQNFPLKLSKELSQGHNISLGLQRNRSISIIPDVELYWKRLLFPEKPDTSFYNMQFEEVGAHLTLPMYWDNFAYIIGLEGSGNSKFKINCDKEWRKEIDGYIKLKYDNLDRLIFPESGWKSDLNLKFGISGNTWMRAKARITGIPFRYRFRKGLTTTFILNLYGSLYSEGTPEHERYSLGGFTPVGSYQLRLMDYEDLPGYRKDKFIEPKMWKVGATARLTLMEMIVVGIRANVHLDGSIYLASAIPAEESIFSFDRIRIFPLGALYFDTTFFNIGFAIKGTNRKFINHFYLSAVIYGLGF